MSRENRIAITPSADEAAGDEIRIQMSLRLRLDQIAATEAVQLRAIAPRTPTHRELRELAWRIYDSRRARDKIIDQKLFGEPAWDMLLSLYCLPARGEIMTASSLSYASCVSPSTGFRWQKTLTDEELIERGPQGVDLRKQMIRLTDKGRTLMDRYLTHLFYCDVPVPEGTEHAED